jgi:hypothetical protein
VATRLQHPPPFYDSLSDSQKLTFRSNFIADVAAVLQIPAGWISIPPADGISMVGSQTQILFTINPDPRIDPAPGGRDVSTTLASQLASEYAIAVQNPSSALYAQNRVVTRTTVSSFVFSSATGVPGPDAGNPAKSKPGDWDFDTDLDNFNLLKILIAAVAGLVVLLLLVVLIRCCKNSCCNRNKSASSSYNSVDNTASRASSKSRLNVEISSPSLVSTTYVEMQPKPPPSSPTFGGRGAPPVPPVSFDEEANWTEVWDPNYKRNYWWNKTTKTASWTKPF